MLKKECITNKMSMKSQKETSVKGRLILTIIFSLIAIFQSGLRDIGKLPEGNDTPSYYTAYRSVSASPWNELFKNISLITSEYDDRDLGYPIFVKITQLVYDDFTFFMFLTAIVFIVPFSMLVFKYVKSYVGIILAFLFYFSIFTNIVNSFMRQAVTLGIVLFSVRYILKHQWKKYYGMMLIAFTIHTSSIVAFPLYFLPKLSKSKKWLSFAFVLSPVLIFFQSTLFNYFVTGTVYDNYVDENAVSPINYLLLIFAISALSYFFYDTLKKTRDYELLVSGVIGLLLILPVVMMGNTMLRISYYYALFLIPLLPVILDSIKIGNKERFACYALLSFFFLYIIFR